LGVTFALMHITHAAYLISSPSVDKCPAPDLPEYAFIGRSNVGKSSLINMLTNKKELAKVSAAPGKTQLINHFSITDSSKNKWYLVDLPGYGYAKRSQSMRKEWKKMIEKYVRDRPNLLTLFVLIDSRIEPQANDLEFINQLGQWKVPFALVFTKTDKTNQREVAKNVNAFLAELSKTWEEPPLFFLTSAIKGTGSKQILSFIGEQNVDFTDREKK
jgi:GTP-binding protein